MTSCHPNILGPKDPSNKYKKAIHLNIAISQPRHMLPSLPVITEGKLLSFDKYRDSLNELFVNLALNDKVQRHCF